MHTRTSFCDKAMFLSCAVNKDSVGSVWSGFKDWIKDRLLEGVGSARKAERSGIGESF